VDRAGPGTGGLERRARWQAWWSEGPREDSGSDVELHPAGSSHSLRLGLLVRPSHGPAGRDPPSRPAFANRLRTMSKRSVKSGFSARPPGYARRTMQIESEE
jgi:hypothetical protein